MGCIVSKLFLDFYIFVICTRPLSLTISSFSIFNLTSEPRANFSGVPGIPEMFCDTNIGDIGCNLLLPSGGTALLLASVKPVDNKRDAGFNI